MTTPPDLTRDPRRTFPLAFVFIWVAVAAGLLASAVLVGDEDARLEPVAVGHIHGMAVSDDGAVLVGAHFGVFRIHPDGGVDPLGGRRSDTMALADGGSGRLIASGHPDLTDVSAPVNAGLLESTDDAESWQAVSLAGEADFHSLDHAGGRTWGIDAVSGQLLTSADERSWSTIEAPVLLDLAADPSGEQRVVAATRGGRLVAVGVDGRRTRLPRAPRLVLVDWPEPDVLVGAEADGTVHTSDDQGATWRRVGEVAGEPTALTSSGRLHYVATTKGVHRFDDESARPETLVTAEH